MTLEEIDDLKPGEEMNSLIAIHVMGCATCYKDRFGYHCACDGRVHQSLIGSMSPTFDIVDKMISDGFYFEMTESKLSGCHVTFWPPGMVAPSSATGKRREDAICIAALKAVLVC